jgi:hypothetical protein
MDLELRLLAIMRTTVTVRGAPLAPSPAEARRLVLPPQAASGTLGCQSHREFVDRGSRPPPGLPVRPAIGHSSLRAYISIGLMSID